MTTLTIFNSTTILIYSSIYSYDILKIVSKPKHIKHVISPFRGASLHGTESFGRRGPVALMKVNLAVPLWMDCGASEQNVIS